MADKNLHDIKIDDLDDNSKKTPLKSILTLLALLFVIFIISIVITTLILDSDEENIIENNISQTVLLNDINKTSDENAKSNREKNDDATAKNDATSKKDESNNLSIPVVSNNIIERNLTSAIKTPLTAHQPKKEVKKEIKTYSTPKKNNEPRTNTVKNTTPKKNTVTKKNTVPKKNTLQVRTPKKEYADKVVAKKNTTSNAHSSSSTKKASYLGGKRKDLTNSYYIKVGTYRDATTVIKKVKHYNFNYAVTKVEHDKTLSRVLVGPFYSRNQANAQLAKVKAHILSGAYVTKVK